MFRDQPSQTLALARSREPKNTKVINIGGRPVIVSQSTTPSIRPPRGESIKLALAFAAIYLVWGSTYLSIRYAVETIPPLVAAGTAHDCWWSLARMGMCVDIVRVASTGLRALYWVLILFIGAGTLHWANGTSHQDSLAADRANRCSFWCSPG
jgi:hypothetical protein